MYKEKGKFHLEHLSAGNFSNIQKNVSQFKPQKQEKQIPEASLLTITQEFTGS